MIIFRQYFYLLIIGTVLYTNVYADDTLPPLRMYVIECGYMDMTDWPDFEAMYGVSPDAVEIAAQVNPCFLVINGNESLLWDAGLPDETPVEPATSPYGVVFSMPLKLADQLESLDVPVEKLDYFAISHLHFDHIGNLPYFNNSRVLLQQLEWEAITANGVEANPGYDTSIIKDLAQFEKLTLVNGDYDVFGDGSVILVHAPGHTNGSQFMIVNLQEYGPVIISGDIIHFREELEHGVLPLFNVDQEEAHKSVQKILSYRDKLKAELWIQHDPVQHKERLIAPKFYE